MKYPGGIIMKKYITKEFKIDKDNNGELIPTEKLSQLDMDALKHNYAIYIYKGSKNIYVGQTKHFLNRHKEHVHNDKGSFINGDFNKVIVIFGQLVTKASLDDIERKLIIYMHADYSHRRQVVIENGTMGNSSPHYSEEDEVNSNLIKPLWENELFQKKYVLNKELHFIKDSILYKYSPFKNLSVEQKTILDNVVESSNNTVIEGLAGTGKTVLLTSIAAKLAKKFPNKKIAVVVKTNWRKNAQDIFSSYNAKNITVKTPFTICRDRINYDYIIVDEAHRLTHYYPKGNNLMTSIFKDENGNYSDRYTQLDFILNLANKATILLYDSAQAIRPNDIPRDRFRNIIRENNFQNYSLTGEYRINISNTSYHAEDFINGIQSFLQINNQPFNPDVFKDYLVSGDDAYFGIVNSIHALFEYTEEMRNYKPSSINRVVAGYTRPWISKIKKDKTGKNINLNKYDWIEDNPNDLSNPYKWKWNDTEENWASRDTEDQIGSIHAVQGIDLNYVGVIISSDIDVVNNKIVGVEANYEDKMGTFIKSKPNSKAFDSFIKNIYYVLLTRGVNGIRIYFENKRLEEYFKKFVGIIR